MYYHDLIGPLLQDEIVADSTCVTQETVVPNPSIPADRRTNLPSTNSEPNILGQGPHPTPRTQAPASYCMETIRNTFRVGGPSTVAASLASHSRQSSTFKTYDSRVSGFINWSLDRKTDPTMASLEDISDLLTSLFQEGCQVSTVCNYHSAVAAVHKGFSDSTIWSNWAILHLLQGMANSPPRKSLSPPWSINDVLHSLARSPYQPIQNSRLPDPTKKTLFLFAASSAWRRSCPYALTINPVTFILKSMVYVWLRIWNLFLNIKLWISSLMTSSFQKFLQYRQNGKTGNSALFDLLSGTWRKQGTSELQTNSLFYQENHTQLPQGTLYPNGWPRWLCHLPKVNQLGVMTLGARLPLRL